jgi:hypothetical protein
MFQQRLLGGRAIRGGTVRTQAGLPDRYPGTRQKKNQGNERGKFRRGGRSAHFFYVYVSRSPPPLALEVTGDLDKEDRRVGGCGGDHGGAYGMGRRDRRATTQGGFFASLSPPICGKTEVTRALD